MIHHLGNVVFDWRFCVCLFCLFVAVGVSCFVRESRLVEKSPSILIAGHISAIK